MPKNTIKQAGIGKEFAAYAIPSVVGMVVSSLYNIIDGIFVGRGVGEDALGAISIVFPYIMLGIALAMLISIGGANHFSVSRGRGDNKAANDYFLISTYLLIAVSLLVNTLVLLFTDEVCILLGADEALLPFAVEYIWWIALFNIVSLPSLGLGIFIRNDNAPKLELVSTLTGTVINIVLDYIFIMELGMGLTGAAVATGIGQMVSFLILLTHFLKKDRVLRFGKVRFSISKTGKILFSGIPSFLMEFSQSAVTFSFNLALMAHVGTVGVSYYSIVMYVCSMLNMVLIGLTQGAQPIMSFKYGRAEFSLVEAIRKLATKTALISTVVIYALVFLFGDKLASIFVSDNAELAQLATNMMRYYFLAFFPIGITLMNILYFQITERAVQSIVLSILRCFGFIQLFLLILPSPFGTIGIYLAFLCGELCHCLLSIIFLKRSQRKKLAI